MADEISVHAARIPDRDRLLKELRDAGLDAKPVGEIDIEVTADDDGAEEQVFSLVEHKIMSIGAPFVPVKHEGVIYVRPPIS
jgi:hypothetical protein